MIDKYFEIEFYKLRKNRLFVGITFFLAIVPIFFAWHISSGSKNVSHEGFFNEATFSITMLMLSRELFIVFIPVIVVASYIFAYEKDSGYLKLLIFHTGDIKRIFLAKIMTIIVAATLTSSFLIVVASIACKVLISNSTLYVKVTAEDISMVMWSYIATIMTSAILGLISLIIAIYVNYSGAILSGICVLILLKFIQNTGNFAMLSPIVLSDIKLYNTGNGIFSIGLLIIYLITLVFIGMHLILRKEIY